jgi:hypothetical protein
MTTTPPSRRHASALIAGLIVLAATPAAWCADAAASAPTGPSWGLHGMLLFGGPDGLYASHLPMFHPPHDRQVVFALRLADATLDKQLRRDLGARPAVWTLVPEKFELARLAPAAANPLTSFKGDIVEGHFERDGVTRHQGVTVQVLRVERFQPLDAGAVPGRKAHYRSVGAGNTWFLVKDLGARPDFDHVLAVRGPRKPAPIELDVSGIAQPADAALQRRLPRGDKLLGTVYFDTADLQ